MIKDNKPLIFKVKWQGCKNSKLYKNAFKLPLPSLVKLAIFILKNQSSISKTPFVVGFWLELRQTQRKTPFVAVLWLGLEQK